MKIIRFVLSKIMYRMKYKTVRKAVTTRWMSEKDSDERHSSVTAAMIFPFAPHKNDSAKALQFAKK